MNADPDNTSTEAACEVSQAPGSGLTSLRLGVVGALFAVAAALAASPHPAHAQAAQQELQSAPSFVDNFSNFNQSRWFVSDGWTNGAHQNCTWSKDLVRLSDGVLSLGFEKRKLKDREFACAEIQTKQRYGYGVYEARMKTGTGSGLNAAFFSYIGPQDKQPWDEIDFEVLTKDPSKVQVNSYIQGKPKNGKLVDVEGGADKGFNDYGFVWEKDRLRWYVNGKLVHEVTNPDELPKHSQKIFFSLWGSDKLTNWMGAFVDPGSKVTMEVKRVAFTALGQPCQFPESLACSISNSN
ncbi:glycoside hydrolase family 16 protein [Mesorhizobium sp. CA18]|uniref:endo-1,3-1,4-beta-glycanase ExoK n=1 Tax=unclassified Mesorhizobium TaxID=325217 RepID=UPI001CCB552C|nr:MULTISPECIES: glycoside hydrolase family 16 protein [unclassified Mesorhizobium]MBZ9731861.1 glycoside hydrolase family 16 protein [Mesorhizobium sp. CA9]MBZ9828047.1 glycoside hydrolase family 16 protein [Mesorhizobium sp. CA18]MBZ9833748.1 glycoside hydrolase family 16 protein [Mesorhizobium sp. CA2]MBZ9837747.1 glycoside hydrolase family 16 protein [Mesorhizobium sp. CA3]MBZ9876786.1 glycoside hydrolase family 16 protein [Mesorhizobium sp. Ca11]